MNGPSDPLREVESLVAERDFDRAAELLTAAAVEDPANTGVRLRLADVLALAGAQEKAADVLDGVGRDLARAGEAAKAIVALKRLHRFRPDSGESERAVVEVLRGVAPGQGARSDTELTAGVARSPLFSDLSRAELLDVIRGLSYQTVAPGDVVVSEGEPGDSLYVLASGQARVFVQGFDRHQREVRRLVSGDFFGEISLLNGTPRTATVIAATECDLLELDRSAVAAISERHPEVRDTIRRFCVERSESVEERSARVGDEDERFEPTPLEEEDPLAEGSAVGPQRLAPGEMAELAPHCTVRPFVAGETIFRRGELGDRLYVLEAGELEVRFEHARPPKHLEPGDLFGELALVTPGRRRTATAVGLGDGRLIVIDRAAWSRLREERPTLLLGILERTCAYLVDSEERLIRDLRRRNSDLERSLDYLQRTREELTTIEARSLTDDLTGIFNRRCFDEQIRRVVERARAGGMALALLLVDVDRFKMVNDTLGHMVGDLVLRRLAQLLRGSVRWTDLPCRIGGDEFALIWSDLDGGSAARRARSLAPALTAFELAGAPKSLRITASLGGALLRSGEGWEELFARADRSLYLAKEAGRGRLAWDERLAEEAAEAS